MISTSEIGRRCAWSGSGAFLCNKLADSGNEFPGDIHDRIRRRNTHLIFGYGFVLRLIVMWVSTRRTRSSSHRSESDSHSLALSLARAFNIRPELPTNDSIRPRRSRPPRICAVPGCFAPTESAACAECAAQLERFRNSETGCRRAANAQVIRRHRADRAPRDDPQNRAKARNFNCVTMLVSILPGP